MDMNKYKIKKALLEILVTSAFLNSNRNEGEFIKITITCNDKVNTKYFPPLNL